MSNAEDPHKVVDLGSRKESRPESRGHLLDQVGEITTRQLKTLSDRMFERVDDALFDLAEKAESNAVQTQYFDGMREARKKRALTERQFLEHVRQALTDVPAKQSPSTRASAPPADVAVHGELSLVDDSELEESLAISSMISKAQSRLTRSLYAVNQRLSVICGGTRIENSNNPIGPAALCEAFRQALHELNAEMRVRLIIYKLFDRYVMTGLEDLYAQVNTQLAQAGVKPNLRHPVPDQRRYQGASSRAYAQAGDQIKRGEAGNTSQADGETGFQADFYQVLNNLLAARRGNAEGGSYARGDVPLLSPAELLGALGLLQTESVPDGPPNADAPPLPDVDPRADVGQVKTHLLHQIHRLRGNPQARMSGADEDTIDLVGMLFQFILEDRNLPTQIQVVLARLQIPYLKVAILDRHMFAHTSHPARRLLNALADAGKSWSTDSDHDRRLYNKIHSIVQTLLQEFDDDLDIFVRLEEDLAGFLKTSHKRAELSEQRVAESTRGREKLQQARRRAAQEVLDRVDRHELPPIIHGILTRAWANYLVLTLLRQGEESAEFRSALRFIDDFVWSALPKQNDEELKRLRHLLPRLEKSLRHGLATVAFQDHDVENLMARLNTLYRTQLGEPVAPGSSPTDTAPLIPDVVETIARPEIANDPEVDTSSEDSSAVEDENNPHLARVRKLKVGTWLEFSANTDADAATERAKLSWISPISGKYLFVNRRGLKVADKTLHQLADEFAAGTTIVLEELPLFDRALDAIVERLRKNQSNRKQDGSSEASDKPSSPPAAPS